MQRTIAGMVEDAVQTLIGLSNGAPAGLLILILMLGTSLLGLQVAPVLLERGVLRPYWLFRRHEYDTLLSSAFLHADLAHLLFNAFTFWAFAFSLERRIGTQVFVLLYVSGMLASAAGTWWTHRSEPGYRTLGASGAILAVLFASIVYFPTSSIFILPIPVPIPAPLFALAYLGFTWYAARRGGGRINHDAHLFGALAGIAFVALSDPAAFVRAQRVVLG